MTLKADNTFMLDEYFSSSNASRRSSFNFAFDDHETQQHSNHDRRTSNASDQSVAIKTVELAHPQFNRVDSTANLVLDDEQHRQNLCTKNIRYVVSGMILLSGCILFIVGICLLFSYDSVEEDEDDNDDDHQPHQSAYKPLGNFLWAIGILIILLCLSVMFLPYKRKESEAKLSNININTLNVTHLSHVLTSLERHGICDESCSSAPKITVTNEDDINKLPTGRSNEGQP